MTLKRFTRPLKHDFSNLDIQPVYEELDQDVSGRHKPLRASHIHKIIMCITALLAALLGAYLIETGESIAVGNTMLKGVGNDTTTASMTPAAVQAFYNNMMNTTAVDTSEPIVHKAKDFNKRKRILALGGSTTWGEKLEKRADSYPSVLAHSLGVHWDVMNIAVQATDASYASQCVESMVREAARSLDDMVHDYDIILMEYSLSGLDNFHLLARRVRRRYPRAIIVYVHLWSLRMTIENAETRMKPASLLKDHDLHEAEGLMSAMIQDPSVTWKYSDEMVAQSKKHSQAGADAIQHVGGLLFELPFMSTPKEAINSGWFSPNYHHLSKEGHRFVANRIHSLINQHEVVSLHTEAVAQYDHSWGKGDQCYSWLRAGESPFVSFEGGTMTKFAEPNRWALQVGGEFGNPATISFENAKEEEQPVRLEVMSWGPDTYPKAKIQLNAPNQMVDDSATVLDPMHPIEFQRSFHVPRNVHIGWAPPGRNSITIDSTETREHPFRVTSIVMCGACVEMDNVYANMQVKQVAGAQGSADQIVAQAMAKEQEIQAKQPGATKQDSIEAFMPPDGSLPSQVIPGTAFGEGTIPQDGIDQTMAHLQHAQAQAQKNQPATDTAQSGPNSLIEANESQGNQENDAVSVVEVADTTVGVPRNNNEANGVQPSERMQPNQVQSIEAAADAIPEVAAAPSTPDVEQMSEGGQSGVVEQADAVVTVSDAAVGVPQNDNDPNGVQPVEHTQQDQPQSVEPGAIPQGAGAPSTPGEQTSEGGQGGDAEHVQDTQDQNIQPVVDVTPLVVSPETALDAKPVETVTADSTRLRRRKV